MEDKLNVVALIVTVLGAWMTWYFATNRARMISSLKKHQKDFDSLEEYSKSTGYKLILRDCFHVITYALSIFFLTYGMNLFLKTSVPIPEFIKWVDTFSAGIYLGSGVVLMEFFLQLSKVYRADIHKEKILKTIERKKEKLSDM